MYMLGDGCQKQGEKVAERARLPKKIANWVKEFEMEAGRQKRGEMAE